MKPIYIGATVQDSGKTSVSLGLMRVLRDRDLNPGYIKPVGQHHVPYKAQNIDEDAVLMHQAFDMQEDPHHLSPIAIERGFTTSFIDNPDVTPLERRINESVEQLRRMHQVLIVEGTGHAGVGSCFGLSNARVAELVNAGVVIVTGGGIGRPIDEVAVSLAMFRDHDVEVLGVILNKVLRPKYDRITSVVSRGLKMLGTQLLGAIPYEPSLTHFTIGQVAEEFGYVVLSGEENLANRIEHTVVAAMEPQNAVSHIRRSTLVIAPGDRLDNILLSTMVMSRDFGNTGGLILTGASELDPLIKRLLGESTIPVLVSHDDTFTVTSRMADAGFKIRVFDTDKIARLRTLVEEHVAVDRILAAVSE